LPRLQYQWCVVGMLWLVCLLNYADRQAIYSVFPLLEAEMHLEDVQLGLIGSSFMWVYALALPLAGWLGDRCGRKALILGGLVFWSLITLATALSTRYWHLLLCRALEGFGEAFYFPASLALLSDYHGPRTRSRALALHQSGVYAGTIVGGAVAGLLAEHYGWRSGFYVFGLLGVLLALVLLGLLIEPRRGQSETSAGSDAGAAPAKQARGTRAPGAPEQDRPGTSVARLLCKPTVLVLIAVFTGANFVAAIVLTWMPKFLYDKFRMSLALAGFSATAYFQVGSVLGVVAGGVLADRLARRHPGGRILTQALGLCLGVPFIFLTGWTRSEPLLVLALFGFGFFKGLYDANIWASLYDVVGPARRASALGIMNAIGWVGGAAAPVVIALAAEQYGMSAALSANSLIYLGLGALLCVGVWTIRHDRAAALPDPVAELPRAAQMLPPR
jgi:MFS family permease